MSDVSVIGLGAMGSAIANALIAGEYDTSVWNRTHGKMQSIDGATAMKTALDAITVSPVTIVCIDDYSATRSLIEEYELGPGISGRILIQFSTGTPGEARQLESWVHDNNGLYLDGSLLAYPREIGHAALIAVSGRESAFTKTQELLAALSSDVRYLGRPVGAAAALNIALLSYYVCTHLGLIHGALVCESEDVPPDLLASVIADSLPSDTEEIRSLGRALADNDFAEPGASLGVYSGVLDGILAQAADAGINAEIAEFADNLYKRGMAAGLADEEVVALIKLLRQ